MGQVKGISAFLIRAGGARHCGLGHGTNTQNVGIAIGSSRFDETAKVWDAESGNELLTLTGHNSSVESVAWSPNGKRLATGSGDGTAKVWDADTGKELLTLSGSRGGVNSVAWSPDGKRLAAASDDGNGSDLRYGYSSSDGLARQRFATHPSEEGCKKYLHIDQCPPVPQLVLTIDVNSTTLFGGGGSSDAPARQSRGGKPVKNRSEQSNSAREGGRGEGAHQFLAA